MRTKLIKIVTILGIIIMNLFFCLFFQIASAEGVTSVTKEQLEGTINSNTPDYLQYAATHKSATNDVFFEFAAEKLVRQNAMIDIYGGSYDNYQYDSPGVICASPAVHYEAKTQKIECIMDISSDGVTVYSFNPNAQGKVTITSTSSDTTNPTKKKAIKYANQLAYFAYMSIYGKGTAEDKIPFTFDNYKSLMRFYCLGRYFDSFKALGVPAKLDPQVAENYNPSSEAKKFYEDALKKLNDETSAGNTFTGRFVFLNGYTSVGSDNGQNDCIFSGKQETKRTLRIMKEDTKGNKLSGAKFNIYHVKNNGTEEKMNNTLLTTNSSGLITYSTKLKVGEKYRIEESRAPTGYQKAEPNSQVITLSQDNTKNKVTFKNPKNNPDGNEISLVKIGERDKEPVQGAKFIFLRYHEGGKGSYIKEEKVTGSNGKKYNKWIKLKERTTTGGVEFSISEKKKENGVTRYWSTNYYDIAHNRDNWYKKTGKTSYEKYDFQQTLDDEIYDKEQPWVKVKCYQTITKNGVTKTVDLGEEWHSVDVSASGTTEWWKKTYYMQCYKEGEGFVQKQAKNITANDTDFIFTTNEAGKITLTGIDKSSKVSTVWAYEIEAPSGYEVIDARKKLSSKFEFPYYPMGNAEEISAGKVITVEEPQTLGNLELTKVDQDNQNIKIDGVQFQFYNQTTQKWVKVDSSGDVSFVDFSEEASTFTTGASTFSNGTTIPDLNGKVSTGFKIGTNLNGKIVLKDIAVGEYVAYEVGAAEGFSNYYEPIGLDGVRVTVASGSTTPKSVTNKRTYADISGIVWLDNIDTMKKSEKNGLYMNSATEQDLLLEGIQVRLVHSVNSAKNMEATTNKDGYYEFKKVLIDDIPYYDVVFTYNGMSYEPAKLEIKSANGNKTAETIQKIETKEEIAKDRTTFNNNYATITKGKSNAHNLTYLTSDYKSELSYREDKNTGKYNYGNDKNQEGRGPVNSIDNQYMIEASTLYGYGGHISKEIADKAEEAKNLIKTTGRLKVENINLGLQTREQPDIALVKDLYRIKVGINGQTHIYNYGDRFNDKLYAQEGNESIYNMNPQVKFGNKYGSMSYTRALYASDIKYSGYKPLEVYVTYRIGIRNNSSDLGVVVNEIVDYTDVKYEFIKENENITSIGRNIDEEGNITGTKLETKEESSGNSEYQKIRIQTNLEIARQTEEYIYIQLQVKPDKIVDILGNSDEQVKLDNIAEISSYSTKDTNGKPYAGIDIDSQPDNTELTNPKTYEDDTDKAPGLKLVLQEDRKISGVVFEDKTGNDDLNSGDIRQGDGKLTSEDKRIKDVTVTLVDVETGEVAKVYNMEKDEWEEAKDKKTDANGEYTIEGLIPGNYKVVYTWGDEHYKVQDYKSTIVDETSYKAKDGNLEWYKDEFKQKYPHVEWSRR